MSPRGRKLAVGCPVHKEALRAPCTCRTGEVNGKSAAGCPVRQEARCLERGCREDDGEGKVAAFKMTARMFSRLGGAVVGSGGVAVFYNQRFVCQLFNLQGFGKGNRLVIAEAFAAEGEGVAVFSQLSYCSVAMLTEAALPPFCKSKPCTLPGMPGTGSSQTPSGDGFSAEQVERAAANSRIDNFFNGIFRILSCL